VVRKGTRGLREQPGGDIILGGANLASTFMRHGLIDQFQLVIPTPWCWDGRPLFEAPAIRMDLNLEGTRSFDNGVVSLRYSYDRAQGTTQAVPRVTDPVHGAMLASSRGGHSSKIRLGRASYLK
jgi:hypothetical protein